MIYKIFRAVFYLSSILLATAVIFNFLVNIFNFFIYSTYNSSETLPLYDKRNFKANSSTYKDLISFVEYLDSSKKKPKPTRYPELTQYSYSKVNTEMTPYNQNLVENQYGELTQTSSNNEKLLRRTFSHLSLKDRLKVCKESHGTVASKIMQKLTQVY